MPRFELAERSRRWIRFSGTIVSGISLVGGVNAMCGPTAAAAQAKRHAFAALLRAVYADVVAGGPSQAPEYATFHDGVRGIAVLDALFASVESGRWCRVASTCYERA